MKKAYPSHEYRHTKNLIELVHASAEEFGDKDYLRYKKGDEIESVTYHQFAEMVDNFGTALYSLGLSGKTIAVIGETAPEWIATYIATIGCGGIIVPLDKELSKEEIYNFIKKSRAEAVVYSKTFAPLMESMAEKDKDIKAFIRFGDSDLPQDERFFDYYDLIQRGEKLIMEGVYDFLYMPQIIKRPAAIIFTSGTTGSAKGVVLSHKNLVTAINSCMAMLQFSKEDVLVSVLPIHHTYEMTCGILTPIAIGLTVCINDSLKRVVKNFQLFKPTALILVPIFVNTIYKKIWDSVNKQGKERAMKFALKFSNGSRKIGIDLRKILFKEVTDAFGGRLKKIVCGGAPLCGDIMPAFDDFGINLVEGYGITECSPLISVCPFTWKKVKSVGLPVPGLELMIDREGDTTEGEIVVRGDNVMLGYFEDEEATRAVLSEDGWFRTGDIGYVDDDGFIYITGRKKNVIVLNNGKNVFPEELEEYLYKIPEIQEAVVLGREINGDLTVTAVIYPSFQKFADEGITDINEISSSIKASIANLNKSLPSFKQIRNIEIRKTEFEKTTTKKIKRFTV